MKKHSSSDKAPTEEAFVGRVTSRIIAKVMQRKKNKKPPYIVFLVSKVFLFIKKYFTQYGSKLSKFLGKFWNLAPVKRYSPPAFFLVLFLLILHPGLHSRAVPKSEKNELSSSKILPRAGVHLQENVQLVINEAESLISLRFEKKTLASYYIQRTQLFSDSFVIRQVENHPIYGISVLMQAMDPANKSFLVLSGNSHQKNYPHHIRMDDDHLDILYPYLRVNTPVLVSDKH